MKPAETPVGHSAGVSLIVLLTSLIYLPSLCGGFLIDDSVLLTRSPLVHAPDGLWRFWFTSEAIDYWPVSNTSFWLEWRLWGSNPTGYRITSLILHIVETLLLWRILSRLTVPGAFLAALLFAVHPVNAETVAWISQRKTLLAMLFVQLATLFYLRSETQGGRDTRASASWSNRWYYAASLVAFVAAMLSKISVAVFPFLLLVVLGWSRPLGRRDVARLLPMLAVAAALLSVNVWYRAGDPHIPQSSPLMESVPRAARIGWFYLGKAVFPVDLAFMYPLPVAAVSEWKSWLPLAGAIAVSLVLLPSRNPVVRSLLYVWAFYWIALLPALGLTERPYVEDHYQHLALLAVAAVVGAGWAALRSSRNVAARGAAMGMVATVVVCFASLTWRHATHFTSNVALMRAAVATYPDSAVAHRNLGFVLLEAAETDEAIEHLEKALRIQPDLVEAHRTLAATLAASGDRERAIDHLKRAIELRPNDPGALANLGAFLREAGRPSEAIPFFERSLEFYPASARTHCNLGKALLEVGEVSRAIEHFEEATRLAPQWAEAERLLGMARKAKRRSRLDGGERGSDRRHCA